MSQWDLDHVGDVINNDSADWFTAKLMKLIHVVDGQAREDLRTGFPAEVTAVEKWELAEKAPITAKMAELERLVMKADDWNLLRLRDSFPELTSLIITQNGG